ncbi:heterogeneous nuclear ribonucleoprotein U-like protein 1 [Pyrus ussuriensis x Pyrus communis]|uniref:Heterogeneous nuclear ribonucleoprotein U-like protein 1 n=1 Tax=Pyrus ussuriensis x Pyrus communis TaxID=2448454 RepID=A0A5N5IG56_9ROSA|nr:heterogeneous nuclear ribonucleoprotein U-like protein 1 [Pyrus ussuriensis x Pyrus communis]
MASAKLEASPSEDEPQEALKKARVAGDDVSSCSSSSEPLSRKQRVVLNRADCALDFVIEGNERRGSALCDQGFIVSFQSVDMEDTKPDQQHLCRLGISRGDDAVGSLGETAFGFGNFSDYGEKFGLGDTIVCAVDLEDKSLASIGFYKNGKWLGRATFFEVKVLGDSGVDTAAGKMEWESGFFPHVLLKNVVVELQFSVEDGLVAEEGFKPWACALEDGNAVMGPAFSDPRACEVVMMVGLPASGKTTWAEKWMKQHPEKRYILLGANLILDQMKVPGLLRKNNYGERFDLLMNRATDIFNVLLSRAATTPRNYIIDQTNVYKSARKRKLKPFVFFRKIAVVVFPSPEVLSVHSKKIMEEMGKEVPVEAVNNMLANFVLPVSKDMRGSDEYFDVAMFVELNREESQRYLDEMKWSLASNNSNTYSVGSSVPTFSPNYGQSLVPPIPPPAPRMTVSYGRPGAPTNPYGSSTSGAYPVGSATTSFTGNAYGHLGGAGDPRSAAPWAPIAPTFLPNPSPPAHGGLPYGTPAPGPQYGHVPPVNTSYHGGHYPPRPGYYY